MRRVLCSVPGCRRTRLQEHFVEFLCADHWRLTDVRIRRRRTAMLKRLKARGEASYSPEGWRLWSDRAARLELASWQRLKRQAIERAAGL